VNKKISILASDLCGRGSRRAYLLAEVLKQLDFDVKVWGFSHQENLDPLPPMGIGIQWVRAGSYPQILGSIKSLLKEIDGSILLPVKLKPTSFGLALLKRLRSRQPVVLDLDGWELSYIKDNSQNRPRLGGLVSNLLSPEGMLRNPDSGIYLQLSEKFLGQADAITVNSKLLEAKVGGTYLPNGTDVKLFDYQKYDRQASKERYGLSGYKILMFAGTVEVDRGLEDILAALDLLNRPEIKLMLVGGKASSEAYVEKLLASKPQWVIKTPQIPREQMPDIFSLADVVVLPWRESLLCAQEVPLQLTEAMAMAKPILATPIGDLPDILGNTGYLVNPGAIEEMAQQIVDILDNPDSAAAQGLKARERCVNYYSLEKMGAILAKILGRF